MENTALRTAARAFIAAHRTQILRDIGRVVAIPSVQSAAVPGAPFGVHVRRALEEGVAIAQELGLRATIENEVMGVCEAAGQGDKTVGIIAHLDVVPFGSGWSSDPCTLTEKDGYLIGRGVADDKGPAILALYAAKFFADQPTPPRHTIRVLLGSDEENGMGDVPAYLADHAAPDFTFTPDGSFPVCNGEKGLFGGSLLHVIGPQDLVLCLEGGVAGNVVADHASALLRATSAAALPTPDAGITLQDTPDGVRIDAVGIAGHASLPEGTVNAIGLIACYLLDHDLLQGDERSYFALLRELLTVSDGSALGIDTSDGVFTPLTIIGGTVSTQNNVICQTMDCRYPTSTTGEQIAATLTARAENAHAKFELSGIDSPFYIAPDSAPIQALLDAYANVTGEVRPPFVMGGGTYARHLPNAVSFGIEEDGEVFPPFVGAIHAANEGFATEKLLRALEIYIVALGALMELDL